MPGPGQACQRCENRTGYDSVGQAYASGLPVVLSNAANVVGFQFTLDYNPNLLSITAVSATSATAAWGSPTWNFESIDSTDELLLVSFSGATGLASGSQELVTINAAVPSGAAYALGTAAL